MRFLRKVLRFLLRHLLGWEPDKKGELIHPWGRVYKDRFRHLTKRKTPKKVRVELYEIISRTPGGRHYWLRSNVGRVKKCADEIPKYLLKRFEKAPKQFSNGYTMVAQPAT